MKIGASSHCRPSHSMARLGSALLLFVVALVGAEEPLLDAEGRQDVSSSVYVTTVTETASTTETTTVSTDTLCVVPGTVTLTDSTSSTVYKATTACRGKRGILPNDVYVGWPQDNPAVQFYRLAPSQVMRFEPSPLPYFVPGYQFGDADVLLGSPAVLEPSFGRQGPFLNGLFNFGLQFSSLVSNIVSNVMMNVFSPASSTTRTRNTRSRTTVAKSTTTKSTSVFTLTVTPTVTITTYTATNTYFVAGTCYPANLDVCPFLASSSVT